MTEKEVQLLVEQLSVERFGQPFLHKAYFNSRLKTTGGRYLLRSHNIELNEKLYKHFGLEELKGVILHELCHYHLHIRGMGYQHRDKDFRELLKKVGAPRFCSSLPETKRKGASKKRKLHTYRCMKCAQIYNRKRKMDASKYSCSQCGGEIQFLFTKEVK